MIESKSIGCTIAAVLLSMTFASGTNAQSPSFPDEVWLLDESNEKGNFAWVAECAWPTEVPESLRAILGREEARPLLKFATNRDGDVAGWRFTAKADQPGRLETTRIPMLWIRATPTSSEWTAVKLPVLDDCTSAAATGVIRVRACENADPTGIFVSGWQQIGSISPSLPDYQPALWYLAATSTGFAAPRLVPIAPYHFDDEVFEGKFEHPREFLSTGEEGSAWATGAIEVLYRDNCDAVEPGPRVVVHATQAYRCVCEDQRRRTVGESLVAYAPMRIVFDLENWLKESAAGSDGCRSIDDCYEPFRWRLTDAYPARLTESTDGWRWLIANREARSVVHVNHAQIAVARATVLNHRPVGCESLFDQCWLEPYTEAVVGPHFGTLVFEDFGSSSIPPADRYLIGAVAGEVIFPGSQGTPRTIIESPRGMELSGPEGYETEMPFVSMQYESAARSTVGGVELITAGWRRWVNQSNPSQPWHRRPLAWIPLESNPATQECVSTEDCQPIIKTNDKTAFTIRGRTVELPLLQHSSQTDESDAWALGCEFVGQSAQCSQLQFVGGGSLGARIWSLDGSNWQVQRLPRCDALTEAHSIMPDGAVVVLGIENCSAETSEIRLRPVRVLLPPPPPRAGDLNGDGFVGAADMSIMLNSFGTSGPCLPADLNGDGFVNAPDLTILLGNWG
jgi:hypothetical protein